MSSQTREINQPAVMAKGDNNVDQDFRQKSSALQV